MSYIFSKHKTVTLLAITILLISVAIILLVFPDQPEVEAFKASILSQEKHLFSH